MALGSSHCSSSIYSGDMKIQICKIDKSISFYGRRTDGRDDYRVETHYRRENAENLFVRRVRETNWSLIQIERPRLVVAGIFMA